MALVGIGLETLLSESDAPTTRPFPSAFISDVKSRGPGFRTMNIT